MYIYLRIYMCIKCIYLCVYANTLISIHAYMKVYFQYKKRTRALITQKATIHFFKKIHQIPIFPLIDI